MPVDVKSLIIRSIAEDMYSFDTTVEHTTSVRASMIDKLAGFVEQISEISTDAPDASYVKLGMLNTTLKALADQEAAATRRVTTKLRHHESIRSDNTSEQVVKLIQSISINRANGSRVDLPPIDLLGISLDLERSLAAAGELIEDTELRVDPDDLR